MLKQAIIIILALLCAILIASTVAVILERYFMPQTAQVNALVTMELDGVQWTNGTTIDWGLVDPDSTYFYPFSVTSISGNYTITLYVSGLPDGWIQTWSANGTMVGFQETVTANLTLYIPPTAYGTASFNAWMEVE